MNRSRPTGFTLMEIILVVVIIGILAALVTPRYYGHVEKTKVTTARTQLGFLRQGLNYFEMTCGRFPTTGEGLEALVRRPEGLAEDVEWEPCLQVEDDAAPRDPWGRAFVYRYPGTKNPDRYDLSSLGPDGQEGTADDVTSSAK